MPAAFQSMPDGLGSATVQFLCGLLPSGLPHSVLPHSGLLPSKMPQQPGNALYQCCCASACALRAPWQLRRICALLSPWDTGVSYCARPFRRGALLWGSWGSSTAGRLIRKSSPFLSGSHLVLSAGTLLWFPTWKRKSRTCALGTAAAGQGGTAIRTQPVCLSSASSWRGPDAGRALEEVPAAPLEGSALFPVSLIAAGSGCCQVLHDSKSAPLLERRGDEAAAPYDDE